MFFAVKFFVILHSPATSCEELSCKCFLNKILPKHHQIILYIEHTDFYAASLGALPLNDLKSSWDTANSQENLISTEIKIVQDQETELQTLLVFS